MRGEFQKKIDRLQPPKKVWKPARKPSFFREGKVYLPRILTFHKEVL